MTQKFDDFTSFWDNANETRKELGQPGLLFKEALDLFKGRTLSDAEMIAFVLKELDISRTQLKRALHEVLDDET